MKFHIYGQNPNHTAVWNHCGKRLAILACMLSVPALSGCSSVNDAISEAILHTSRIISEEERQQYIQLRKNGQLGSDGTYLSPELAAEPVPEPEGIHVTFATNAYIDVKYYLDAGKTRPIDPKSCYLTPGSCIYASEPVCNHPVTSQYSFDRFHVYAYDEAGRKGEELFWTEDGDDPLFVLRVPADYEGTDISIEPAGKYEKRTITLEAYYIDSAGQRQRLSGTWLVNEQEVAGRTVEVNPVESLAVDFDFKDIHEEYSFVSSDPTSFYSEDGLVRFETTYPSSKTDTYSVELRPLQIDTFKFNPARFPGIHGTVTFRNQRTGQPLTEECTLNDGDIIQYTAIPDANYHPLNETGQIIVNASDPDKTMDEIQEAIKFYKNETVTVILPRPIGGRIEYTAEGAVLEGNSCPLRYGTVITMHFYPWNRWQCNVLDGTEYVVTEQEYQSVSLPNVDINTGIFEENPDYMPNLNVILTESVQNAKFTISAAGVPPEGHTYADGSKTGSFLDWAGQNDRLVFSGAVGTSEGITLQITDDTILNGYALKLEITMEGTKKGETEKSIRYITKLPVAETIQLYSAEEQATTNKVYKDIRIQISKVEVASYQAKTVEHASLTATLQDVSLPCELKDGDLLDASRNITVAITPDDGYYITGSKVEQNIYRETMKYSAWEKNAEKILEKHPVKKLWYVTLDTSDEYGTCAYKLDGDTVSGRVGIHEGQKLTLEYTLTDPNYKIARNGVDGFIGGLISQETEKCTIDVSEKLDGTTIKRSDYITIEPKED